MRFALDLVFLDFDLRPVALRRAVPPRRLVFERGAQAVLELPVAAGRRRELMLPAVEPVATVVVCEDDAPTLELLCDHLEADRFRALPAPSASDALRLCHYKAARPPAPGPAPSRRRRASTSCARSGPPAGRAAATTRRCR